MKVLAAEFNRTHPHITVTPQFYGNSDYALQKVLSAIAGGDPPDISYLYGSNAANIASTPKVVPLTNWLHRGQGVRLGPLLPVRARGRDRQWQGRRRSGAGRQPGARLQQDAVQEGRPVVPDRQLDLGRHEAGRAQADQPGQEAVRLGLRQRRAARTPSGASGRCSGRPAATSSPPTASRRRSTPRPASRRSPTCRASPRRTRSISTTARTTTCHLFGSGHIGMLWTGPWDLEQIRQSKVDYGVKILPGDENHQTISGPDNWVMFNNGSKRVAASWEFLKWFTSPKIDLQWCLGTGDLPIRDDVQSLPGFKTYLKRYPGVEEWVHNLTNSKQTRPVVRRLSEDLDGDRPGGAGRAARQVPAQAGARPSGADDQRPAERATAGLMSAVADNAGARQRPPRARPSRLKRLIGSEHLAGWMFVAPGGDPDRDLLPDPDRLVADPVAAGQQPARLPPLRRPGQLQRALQGPRVPLRGGPHACSTR